MTDVQTLVMGILNVTPNSFSDGGQHVEPEQAIRHGYALTEAGADIIDIGGEATWPGVERVSAHEEQQRVLPVVRHLASNGVRVSVDTMNASTAAAAIDAGARFVNDVSGGLADPNMSDVIAQSDVVYIATHWRAHGATANNMAHYDDPVSDVCGELGRRVQSLTAAGIPRERLVLDPGFGFSKTSQHNWQILAGLRRFDEFDLPLMVGVSRKRFLGELFAADAPIEARDLPTALITSLVAGHAWAVRVHDVAGSVAALRIRKTLNNAGCTNSVPQAGAARASTAPVYAKTEDTSSRRVTAGTRA